MKTKIKNYGTVALFVAFSLIATVTLAHEGRGDAPVAELKFIGNLKNQPVFQLDLNNANQEDLTITIRDQSGEVLYSEKVKAKNFTRKFQLNTDEIGDEILKVEVRSSNSNKPAVFTINRDSRYVVETNISKL